MKLATLLKPALIAGLAHALYVPVTMIQGLVLERQLRAQQAVSQQRLKGSSGWPFYRRVRKVTLRLGNLLPNHNRYARIG